jgi:MFS family permease
MAALMITGGKIGGIIGRKRAFSIGCVIYGAGSFTTSLAHSLTVLIIGWSFLEGVGAALILPAVVALVAANFPAEARPKAYGLVSAAGAVAVAAGPLIGGLFTTYWSWRYVFAGEVLIVIAILIFGRGIVDEPPGVRPKLDYVGVVLSAGGLTLAVLGVLKSGTWGWIHAKDGAPTLWGISLTFWFLITGVFILWLFLEWEGRREAEGKEPLVNRTLFRVRQLRGGLRIFFFQYFVQSGVFFVVPLFLSVSLGLSAIATGVRLLPLSITLLIAAIGVPRFLPNASPRRVVRIGLFLMFLGDVVLLAAIDAQATASIVLVPLLLLGLGIGALASQLGSVTVSSVPDELSPEVGGLQNTATNIGTSLGTALAGAVLIAVLTSVFLTGIQNNPDVPSRVSEKATTELAGGIPFISDADLRAALDDAHVSKSTADAIVDENSTARLEALQAALGIVAFVALLGLFMAGGIPKEQPKSAPKELILDGGPG